MILTVSEEIRLRPQTTAWGPVFARIQRLRKYRSALPFYPALRSIVRPGFAVMEPAGRLMIRRWPILAPQGASDVTVTVLSANLWHDWPRQRSRTARLEALARLMEVERVDVALLQEVSRTRSLAADEWLADELGMAYVYARANGHEQAVGFEEGLAVFSRYPLRAPRLREFRSTAAPFARRIALGATLDSPAGELQAFSVHLSLARQRNARQFGQLQAWVDQLGRDRPALIGGDFNAGEQMPQISQAQRTWLDLFRHLHPDAQADTHQIRCPRSGQLLRSSRLDYLFLRPNGHRWKVLEARHLDAPGAGISDHQAVLARLAPDHTMDRAGI
jgi:endonuclease/exonuclease/phosphatase family metal-dependent hydrolase